MKNEHIWLSCIFGLLLLLFIYVVMSPSKMEYTEQRITDLENKVKLLDDKLETLIFLEKK